MTDGGNGQMIIAVFAMCAIFASSSASSVLFAPKAAASFAAGAPRGVATSGVASASSAKAMAADPGRAEKAT